MTVLNPKAKRPEQMIASATGIEAVTKSDTVGLAVASIGIWVGVTGDLSVVMVDGSTAVIPAVPAGSLLPIQVTRVNATGTTANAIVSFN